MGGTDARRRNRFVAPTGWQIVGLQFEGHDLKGTHVERVPKSGKGSVTQVSGHTGTDVDGISLHLRGGSTHSYGRSDGEEHMWTLESTEIIRVVEQGHRDSGLGITLAFYT